MTNEEEEEHVLSPLCSIYQDTFIREINKIVKQEKDDVEALDLVHVYSLQNIIQEICEQDEEQIRPPPETMVI